MKSIFKKWWFWVMAVIVILGLILPPFIINANSKSTHSIPLWNNSDMLSYYGSALSFFGTIILGIIAVWQNNHANEINDRVSKMEMQSKRGYFIPEKSEEVKFEDGRRIFPYVHRLQSSGISLLCCGDDCVYVSTVKYLINNKWTEIQSGLFVTNHGEFNKMLIPIELNEKEREQHRIQVTIDIYMNNSKGYYYHQILYLDFKKIAVGAYEVSSFNAKFKDCDNT